MRRKVRLHLKRLGFSKGPDGELVPPGLDKQSYRDMHAEQRGSRIISNQGWIDVNAGGLIQHFASGAELNVAKIRPRLEVVLARTWQADLFRLATYYWRILFRRAMGGG